MAVEEYQESSASRKGKRRPPTATPISNLIALPLGLLGMELQPIARQPSISPLGYSSTNY